jgi:hypothetical protein
VTCIATRSRINASVADASLVSTTALAPLTTPRLGAANRATTPWLRSFLFSSVSGRYVRSTRSCGVTFEFQYGAPPEDVEAAEVCDEVVVVPAPAPPRPKPPPPVEGSEYGSISPG